jgi:hypothetical protein
MAASTIAQHDWQNIQGFWLVFNLFLALGSVFLL